MAKTKIQALRDRAAALPTVPGVYLMKNEDGTVLYVGKSRNLRARVSSYFTGTGHTVKTARMVASVSEFDTIVCDSEMEALGLENTLIKQYAPRYNIKLKDARSYPYIKITREAFPRVTVTRDRMGDGALYFGPYSGTADAYANLDTVRRVFRLPTCKRQFPRDVGKERPCLYRQMGRCLAPCAGDVTKAEFSSAVKSAAAVLSGDVKEVASTLRAEMTALAQREEYEAAARKRDALFALEKLGETQKVLSDTHVYTDVWALASDEVMGAMAVLSIREGRLNRKNDFAFSATEILEEDTALSFLTDYYLRGADIPKNILLAFPVEEEDAEALSLFLSEKKGRKVAVSIPLRGEKRALCQMAEKNAKRALEKRREDLEKEDEVMVALASLLSLEVLPERTEVYDVSHLGGEYTTAGMIVYAEGRLQKNAYRTFRMKGVTNDDCAAMKEALSRRFAHKEDEAFGSLPDLILLDGGKGQVTAGKEALREAGLDIPVFGLVKDDFHKTRALCDEENDVSIAKEQGVYALLYRLQEEVHRHALRATMGAKGKSLRRSSLESIPGIGKERAKKLLSAFGGLARIKAAERNELAAVKGMTKEAADAVYRHYHKEEGEQRL
ncbi:MAG: excinuclease ABC subunit UvrC [Clostridia bacterium]|nr:excinuclease ABC subunit UvrC [Clostridia bacterium]